MTYETRLPLIAINLRPSNFYSCPEPMARLKLMLKAPGLPSLGWVANYYAAFVQNVIDYSWFLDWEIHVSTLQVASAFNTEHAWQVTGPSFDAFDFTLDRLSFSGRNGSVMDLGVCTRYEQPPCHKLKSTSHWSYNSSLAFDSWIVFAGALSDYEDWW